MRRYATGRGPLRAAAEEGVCSAAGKNDLARVNGGRATDYGRQPRVGQSGYRGRFGQFWMDFSLIKGEL